IDHSENARTGTAARGREASSDVLGLRGTRGEVRTRDAAAPSELGVVNLITHHEEEANEQLASYGHAGLRATLEYSTALKQAGNPRTGRAPVSRTSHKY